MFDLVTVVVGHASVASVADQCVWPGRGSKSFWDLASRRGELGGGEVGVEQLVWRLIITLDLERLGGAQSYASALEGPGETATLY